MSILTDWVAKIYTVSVFLDRRGFDNDITRHAQIGEEVEDLRRVWPFMKFYLSLQVGQNSWFLNISNILERFFLIFTRLLFNHCLLDNTSINALISWGWVRGVLRRLEEAIILSGGIFNGRYWWASDADIFLWFLRQRCIQLFSAFLPLDTLLEFWIEV